jgi:inorganic triphosphatase YgiF
MLAPSIASSRELELKLELPGDEFYRLGESPLRNASTEAHARKTLGSTYSDTPEHSFGERISLRLRNDGENQWLQTVKAAEEPKGGLFDVAESEVLLEKCEPDLDRIGDKRLRREIKNICDKSDLINWRVGLTRLQIGPSKHPLALD